MATPCIAVNGVRHLRPPITIPKPTVWPGKLLSAICSHQQLPEKYEEDIEALKKEAKSMLLEAAKPSKVVVLVDIIERLGLAYHFETEIQDKLSQVYHCEEDEDYDLFTTALRFRLLRQHQFHVSCDDFDKFVDKNNKFKETLSTDVEGLLSLYEAAHVRIHDENILDEGVMFTTCHLSRILPELESPLKDKVQLALKHSLHRSVLIINVPFHISIYEQDDSKDELLLKFSKLNLMFLQNVYRNELAELSRWWNGFDLKSKLPYMRDRLVECFLWGAAVHYEPKYSFVRINVAKNMQMVSVMDDTYDNYATLDEAQMFTQILERWNVEEIDVLPEYMQIVYKFVMSTYEDLKREAIKQGKSFVVPYYSETVKQLGRAYNKEQIWIMERQMPSFEEYMNNSMITSCIYVMFTSLVPGIQSITKETIDWLLSEPKIVISTAKMGRHLEDLASHERENREGKLLTVVDCYMKDYGVSKEETLCRFKQLVENGWKDVNKEWTKERSTPKKMVDQLVNYARIAEITYENSEDGYTSSQNLAPKIAALIGVSINSI
uniref:Terpene synthase 1 n=1 Tax=Scutellaria barbata TaxID=396367 RepID=A0A6B7LU35_9LAMI|nr:terpene synthase 1 [Scutellaria barbata]